MKTILVIIIFLLMNAFFIISDNALALKNEGNIGKFFSLYSQWIKEVKSNLLTITGDVIKLKWIASENAKI